MRDKYCKETKDCKNEFELGLYITKKLHIMCLRQLLVEENVKFDKVSSRLTFATIFVCSKF